MFFPEKSDRPQSLQDLHYNYISCHSPTLEGEERGRVGGAGTPTDQLKTTRTPPEVETQRTGSR